MATRQAAPRQDREEGGTRRGKADRKGARGVRGRLLLRGKIHEGDFPRVEIVGDSKIAKSEIEIEEPAARHSVD